MKINIYKFLIINGLGFLFLGMSCGKNGDSDMNPILPEISIDPVFKLEGNDQTTFDFKVRLSESSKKTVTIDFQTEGGTAAAMEDFIPVSGTLTFNPPELNLTISVEIVTDTLKEFDEEFKVVLSNPQNATLNDEFATGTIRNDDTFIEIPEDGYITPETYAGWTKIWADEFEGTQIDVNKWTHETGNHGWGNNELQNYTTSPLNSHISDGKLVIEARKESSGGSDYSSARMITAGKFEFKYGRVDIRAKLPEGQGIWPALWMLGANLWTAGWPACGEIDIMELVGHQPHIVYGAAHWGVDFPNHLYKTGSANLDGGEKFSEKFHVFSIIWEPNEINYYLDEVLYHTVSPADMQGQPYPFNHEFFFIFNIAVGGNWPGSPDGSTVFPQQMIVDYIRVFQQ